jgi:carbonic anhydrase/acetyltransferase-like protein (isoleucine patch superfamily)
VETCLVDRKNGRRPSLDPSARAATSAQIVGEVTIGARCIVDHNVVLESAGPRIEIRPEVVVFAESVRRSVGGSRRPPFALSVRSSLVGPLRALTGCRIGRNCYIATGAIALQGAIVSDHTRIGAGAIVHARTELPERTRAARGRPDARRLREQPEVEQVRTTALTGALLGAAFGADEDHQARLHEHVIGTLLEEVHSWKDEPA